jgi:plasmid rolling circle replication initiator protein Rep
MPKNITEPQILQDPHNGKERPWRVKKMRSNALAYSFERLGQMKKAARIWNCGSVLTFSVNKETGEQRLHDANFCRERLCPMCSWRRSLKVFHEVSRVMSKAQADNPELVPLFLTLTLRNVPGDKLSETLDTVFSGWKRLGGNPGTRFRRIVPGWFRALEVTYNAKSDTFHPHIHAILFVHQDYFKRSSKDYTTTAEWVQMWRRALRLDYDPVCNIQRVKGQKALSEVSKYTVKDTDYIRKDPKLTDKLVDTLSGALKGRRLYAFGGVLKDVAKTLDAVEPDTGDLVAIDGETVRRDVATLLLTYRWSFGFKNYILAKIGLGRGDPAPD